MAAVVSSSVSASALSLFQPKKLIPRKCSISMSASSSSAEASHGESKSTEKFGVSEKGKPPELPYSYSLVNPNGSSVVQFVQSTESNIERVIFDFRFLALLAVGGSLAGSVLCFLNGLFDSCQDTGCVYIFDAYKVYWTSCVKGVHSGQMVLRLVEAIDVYLAGTVMLIFGMGLYGLFISNVSPNVTPASDRALRGSSLFGMFALKERPKWMKISSLNELKTKVGHVIVMILLVKMFERSKMSTNEEKIIVV
ncbi:hypothetical protein SASPL_101835 [Salvia splendens]|uniref:Uncharacterized protein n=1 Tax=Salvia splendens TaxID=180675 RepID=A0A8X8YSJ7_SALSN|nr:hypothetical protein SASPL_101835 [Salvia splendens]